MVYVGIAWTINEGDSKYFSYCTIFGTPKSSLISVLISGVVDLLKKIDMLPLFICYPDMLS